ncbi:hypothetical protein Bbelb_160640 [Branchiostoma belcheri]|nr:hypothetical protein Bbelb_160640 [Branchiostoma belcheri]
MLRVCEKLREADAKRKRHGLARTETDYLRALVDALADMDRVVEVELLKTLGDVNLEKGRLRGKSVKFRAKAMALYRATLRRCQDAGVAESLQNRLRYAEKLRLGKTTEALRNYEPSTTCNKLSSLANVAETFRLLDKRFADGGYKESLLIGYTNLMVEGIANEDCMLETEAIKTLGDVYLKRGTETRDSTCLTKATALYNTALERCERVQGREALIHRLLYTARIRQGLQDSGTGTPVLKGFQHWKPSAETTFRTGTPVLGCRRHWTSSADAVLSIESALEHQCGRRGFRGLASVSKRRRQQQADVPRSLPVMSANNTDVSIRDEKGQQFMSYDDHLTEGDRALTDGKLDTAEEKFASALRMTHDPNKPDCTKEAECLCRLGDVYVQRGKRTEEGRKFTQAAALYNAAMARTDRGKDRIQNSLQDTEKWFLHHTAHVDSKPSLPDSAMRHQKLLKDMRARAKSQVEAIDHQHNPYQYDEDDPKMLPVEAKRAEAVKALFKTIAKDRQTFIQTLVDECIATLGPPPCKYAFIGLGSQATELVTPYSDLEFAILTEEGKDDDVTRRYFINLTHYLHLKVINLGETILPAMAIPSLNDFYSEDQERNWFFDSVTPRGFSFDGFMPWACKTPFGRDTTKTKQPVSLIQTPAKMAAFQQLEVALTEGYHLSDILRRFVFLAGDETLVSEYRERLDEVVTNDVLSDFKSRLSAVQILQENREILSAREPTGKLLNVKKDIYRFPGVAVEVLALCCQVNLASTWAVIDRLKKTGQVQEENATHLTVLTGISAELRLRTYMANRGQKDSLSPLAEMKFQTKTEEMSDTTLKSEFHIPDTQILFRYYCRAIPLKKCIPDIVQYDSQDQSRSVFKTTIFDISNACRGRIAKTLFQSSKCMKHFEAALKEAGSDMAIRAEILVEFGEYFASHGDIIKANKYLEESVKIHKTIHGDNAANYVFASSLASLGVSWGILGKPENAMGYLEQSLKMFKTIFGDKPAYVDIIAATHSNLGLCWSDLGDHKKAKSYFEQSLEMRKTVHGETAHEKVASSLGHLGSCWSKLGDEEKAISYYEQSLAMTKTIYGQNTVHPYIALLLNNLGLSYNKLGNQKKALSYHEQSLMMKKAIYGETCHRDIATSLLNIGLTWSKLDNHHKAIRYFEESLVMSKTVYGEHEAHPEIPTVLFNIGYSWQTLGDYREAISYYEQFIAMKKIIHGHDMAHPKVFETFGNLGLCWSELRDEKKAISYFEQSLRTAKAIHAYGDNKAHHNIAKLLELVGESWRKRGDQKKAIRYFEQALVAAKTACGDNTPDPFIALLLRNIGLCWDELGDQKEAIRYYEQSLRTAKTIYGDKKAHHDIAKLLELLGESWRKLGDQKKAIRCFEQALGVAKTTCEDNTPDPFIALLLRNIGLCWDELGDQKEAIRYYEHSLRTAKTIYGDKEAHHDIAKPLELLGASWRKLGDQKKAISFFERALRVTTTVCGDNTVHPYIAFLLRNIGLCWDELGNQKEAIRYYEHSLTMEKTIKGPNTVDINVARLLTDLGISCSKLRDDRKAIHHLEQSLSMMETIYGRDTPHQDVVRTLDTLGTSWSRLDGRKSISYYEQSLAMQQTIYGDDKATPESAGTLCNLGLSWSELGDNKKAISYFEQSCSTMRKTLHGNNKKHSYIVALSLLELGSSWSKVGDQKRAIRYLEQSLTMMKTVYGDNKAHMDIAKILFKLGLAWGKHGYQEKAMEFFEQSRSMSYHASGTLQF